MSDAPRDVSKLKDSELTKEELAKRIKNREKRAKQRAGKDSKTPQNNSIQNETKNKSQKPANNVRMSQEDYNKHQVATKSQRIEQDPRNAVVTIAETNESRALAYQVQNINIVTSFTRANIGTDRLPWEEGTEIIKFFADLTEMIEEGIQLAASHGVGSRRTLDEYKKAQNKILSNEKRIAGERKKSESNEDEAETKQREKLNKELEDANAKLTKAQEALEIAQKDQFTAQENVDKGYSERIIAQRQRVKDEKTEVKSTDEKTPEATTSKTKTTTVKATKPAAKASTAEAAS